MPDSSFKSGPVFPTANPDCTGHPIPKEVERQYPSNMPESLPEKSRDKVFIVFHIRRNIGEEQGRLVRG